MYNVQKKGATYEILSIANSLCNSTWPLETILETPLTDKPMGLPFLRFTAISRYKSTSLSRQIYFQISALCC